MDERPWFRARESGMGWTPVTWQGWLVTLASAAVAVAVNLVGVAYIIAAHR